MRKFVLSLIAATAISGSALAADAALTGNTGADVSAGPAAASTSTDATASAKPAAKHHAKHHAAKKDAKKDDAAKMDSNEAK